MEIDKIIEQFFNVKLLKTEKLDDSWSLTFKPGVMLTWSDIDWLKSKGWHIYGIVHSREHLIIQITTKGSLAK